jgi:hypothetical protein
LDSKASLDGFVACAPLRKRLAFVVGNDEQDTSFTSKSFKPAKIYSLKLALEPPVARANGDAV